MRLAVHCGLFERRCIAIRNVGKLQSQQLPCGFHLPMFALQGGKQRFQFCISGGSQTQQGKEILFLVGMVVASGRVEVTHYPTCRLLRLPVGTVLRQVVAQFGQGLQLVLDATMAGFENVQRLVETWGDR